MNIKHLFIKQFCAISLVLIINFQRVSCEVPDNTSGTKKFSPRIIDGKPAVEGSFRGIVSLQTWKGQHICGGTWIKIGDVSQIITAAHCLEDSKKRKLPRLVLQVMGDDLSISRFSPGKKRQIRKLRRTVTHPQYNPSKLVNDIAILFLASHFNETSTFSPVKITTKSVKDNQLCTVAGWGVTREDGEPSIELLETNVSVIPWKICNSANSYGGGVGKHAFCAGHIEGGSDSCQGDSGGGLMSENALVGVVSFGTGCGRKNYPGVYTNVFHYTSWIEKTISSSSVIKQSNIFMITTIIIALLTRSILY